MSTEKRAAHDLRLGRRDDEQNLTKVYLRRLKETIADPQAFNEVIALLRSDVDMKIEEVRELADAFAFKMSGRKKELAIEHIVAQHTNAMAAILKSRANRNKSAA